MKAEYNLIPLTEITDEAREIAVAWCENYQRMGFDIQQKHKLASDIMNYARHENADLIIGQEQMALDLTRAIDLVEEAFIAGRSKTTWHQFKIDNDIIK